MSADTDSIRSAAADAAAAPLDLLLTDAAVGTLRRMNPGGSGLRLAAALATRPRLVAGRGRHLAAELARITVGTSQVQPSRRDRRFADPGWAGNPLLRRAMQAYLAATHTADGVVADAGLDGKDAERVGFVLTNLVDALAPSNNPLLNPAAVKAAIDTGGGSAVAGLRHFLTDMAVPPRVPSMVEPDAFEVGVDLAVTPGSVVLRTPVFELIQYRPATAAVRQVPLLVVPPTINKFYVMDLAPGRSLSSVIPVRPSSPSCRNSPTISPTYWRCRRPPSSRWPTLRSGHPAPGPAQPALLGGSGKRPGEPGRGLPRKHPPDRHLGAAAPGTGDRGAVPGQP